MQVQTDYPDLHNSPPPPFWGSKEIFFEMRASEIIEDDVIFQWQGEPQLQAEVRFAERVLDNSPALVPGHGLIWDDVNIQKAAF